MSNTYWDYIIIGAGIIGTTIAREIKNTFPKAKVLLLEKEPTLGLHASGRNSGVLHTGIYYPADTLKAKFCKNGAELLFSYAIDHQIPVIRSGKLIVATSEVELKQLEKLMKNAKDSHINAELVEGKQIREIEPCALNKFAGIYCKDTANIDSKQVLATINQELKQKNVDIFYNQKIVRIDDKKQIIYTQDNAYSYGLFINAAGSYADKVAKLVNVGHQYELVPFKGTYYKLDDSVKHLVRSNIYPVPNPDLPFLGVHFTRSITGDVYIGPTIIPTFGRENYHFLQGIKINESLSIFTKLAKLYYRDQNNFRNLIKKGIVQSTKSGIIRSARKLMCELQSHWVKPSPKVGIRPQLIDTKKMQLEMDFVIEKGDNSIHILNSISPAFTSSFAVAKYIVNEIKACT